MNTELIRTFRNEFPEATTEHSFYKGKEKELELFSRQHVVFLIAALLDLGIPELESLLDLSKRHHERKTLEGVPVEEITIESLRNALQPIHLSLDDRIWIAEKINRLLLYDEPETTA